MIHKLTTNKGILLIELLVAILIAAILFAGILTVLRSGIAAYQKVERLSNPIYQTRALFALVENQLHNMIYYSEAPFTGEKNKFMFPAVLESYSEDRISTIPSSVEYQYREKALYRTEKPLKNFFSENEGDTKKIISSLNSFIVQYAYRRSSSPEIVWQDTWPAGQGLPRGIKITLSLEMGTDKRTKKTENFMVTKKFFIPHGNWGWLEKGL